MVTNKICRYECQTFSSTLYRVLQSTEVLEKKALDTIDPNPLYVAYWRLLFIEPYAYRGESKYYPLISSDDIKTRINRIENRVKNPALTGGALKNLKTISTACRGHDGDT
jgi:hypothetical protein